MDQALYHQGDTLNAKIRLTNDGVGHYFPTYLTPKIDGEAYLLDAEGNIVYPDHFYSRFYEAMLGNGSAGRDTKLIEQALKESQASSSTLFEKTIPLGINSKTVEIKGLKPSPARTKPVTSHIQEPDWNAGQIKWFDYEKGLQVAKQGGDADFLCRLVPNMPRL